MSVAEYFKNPTKEQRNRYIGARMAVINIRYFEFAAELTRDKQLLDASTDILVLTLNLAGAALTPASTKTVLAAISAGVTGSKAVVDRTFFYEKTVGALVAQMNARRAQMAARILTRTDDSLEDYSFSQAFSDVNEFESAGRLASAVAAIQAEAAAQEKEAKQQLQRLQLLSAENRDLKRKLTAAIGRLQPSDNPKVQAALAALQVPNPPPQFPAARDLLQQQVREARDPDRIRAVADAFERAQLSF